MSRSACYGELQFRQAEACVKKAMPIEQVEKCQTPTGQYYDISFFYIDYRKAEVLNACFPI